MDLATLLRYLQFYTHIAHNILSGETFFSDHPYLGDLYGTYEDAYDAVIERMIGEDEDPDLIKIHQDAVQDLKLPTSYAECFKNLLEQEKALCKEIEKLMPQCTEGTKNLLAGLADESEARQYKFKQRTKKEKESSSQESY